MKTNLFSTDTELGLKRVRVGASDDDDVVCLGTYKIQHFTHTTNKVGSSGKQFGTA